MTRRIVTTFRAVILAFLFWNVLAAQNVFLIVIDGARFSETFDAGTTYIPRIWDTLRMQATIYPNFYNDGVTETNSGFASLLTGTWQDLANDGSEFPDKPTVFEYFRKYTGAPESTCTVIAGKKKLHILRSSRSPDYGKKYQASFYTSDTYDDLDTWEMVLDVVEHTHPRLVVVGFPEVDYQAHRGRWNGYLSALRQVDSLIVQLWKKIQSDPFYKNTTTMFVTNDHGRHTDATKGFRNHGDSCEGCRHIMLLAAGPRFEPNTVVTDSAFQIDIAPTIGDIMGFPTPQADGKSLLREKNN